MNGDKTFKKELRPNGSRKKYQRSYGIASEIYGGTGSHTQHAGVAVQELMEAEITGIVGAEKNTHSPSRSGYRPQWLDTHMGTMHLMVPKLRSRPSRPGSGKFGKPLPLN